MRVRSIALVATIAAGAAASCDDYGADDPIVDSTTDSGIDSGMSDVAAEATTADAGSGCSHDAPFARSKVVPGTGIETYVGVPRLTHDELQLFFAASVDGGNGDLFVASRSGVDVPFGARQPLGTLNTEDAHELDPSVSADGRTIFFGRASTGTGPEIWVSTRSTPLVAFGPPNLFAANTADSESTPYVLAGGDIVYFTKTVGSSADIHRAVVGPGGSVSSAPAPGLNGPMQDTNVVVTDDERTAYFASDRNGGGDYDIFVAHRNARDEAFGTPTEVGELRSTTSEWPSWISPDGCRLYYLTPSGSAYEVRVAERDR